jgi:RNA polymerase sigma factor (sigma-70 family)
MTVDMHDRPAPDERVDPALGDHFSRILAAAQAGGEWAWRELYGATAPLLTRYLRARGVPDADDIVGETFIRVVRNIERFEGDEGRFRTWVFTIGRNLVVDDIRRRARHPADVATNDQLAAAGPTGDTEDDALRGLGSEHVAAILEGLSPDQRDVLLLRILGGLTIAEIAEVVGKREGAVKMLQARGLTAIRREISIGAVTL